MSKLQSFAAENATDYSYHNSNTGSFNQQKTWSPNMTHNHDHHHHHGCNHSHKMNTWTNNQESNTHGRFQNMSDEMSPGPFKKVRNLSNENNKMQRYVSDFQVNGQQMQQSYFGNISQNQNTVQPHVHTTHCQHNHINLGKGNDIFDNNVSSATVSTNENSNSDVEIIEDDYA